MKKLLLCTVLIACQFVAGGDSPCFRGPDRDGHYNESGLLKSWPENGPALMWSVDGLGQGYSAVSTSGDKVFVTGKVDNTGWLFAYNLKGELLWKTEYGDETNGSGFPGARTTPSIHKGVAYLISGVGVVSAFSVANGNKIWSVDVAQKFDAKPPYFGTSESVLIDGGNLICTPGGADATLVALNLENGDVVWTSKGLSDRASYCSARIFDNGGRRQVVTLTAKSMVGVDAANGTLKWQTPYPAQYDIHAVPPLFLGSMIYVVDGYKQGGAMFEMAADGTSVTKKWADKELDIHHGGSVLVDGYIYGSSSSGKWGCMDMATGRLVAEHRDLDKGAAVFADGMLYGYDEKGKVGLMTVGPENFKLVSSFEITKGSGQHWAHPVISNGIMFIRHGDVLMAFNVKEEGS